MSRIMVRWMPLALAAAFLALVLLVVAGRGIDPATVMRDFAATAKVHPLTGLMSAMGVLLWCAAAAVCTFAAVACQERADRQGAAFFASAALLSAYLTIDDMFMIHDYLAPTYLHIRSKAVTLGIALTTVAFVIVWARFLLKSRVTMFALAAVLLASSLLVDEVIEPLVSAYIGPWRIALEDGFKFLGAACWLAYFSEAGLDRIRALQTKADSEAAR